MPSQAQKTFQDNLVYVNSIRSGPFQGVKASLFKIRGDKRKSRSNRKGQKLNYAEELNHTNRAAIIILCGSWQQYIEDVVLASGCVFVKSMSESSNLSKSEQNKIGGSTKNSTNGSTALETAKTNWNSTYKKYIKAAIKEFQSPTCRNIDILFSKSIGVTCDIFLQPDFLENGESLEEFIKEFVETRNRIAHQGVKDNQLITTEYVTRRVNVIRRLVVEIDKYLFLQLKKMHPKGAPPWSGKVK